MPLCSFAPFALKLEIEPTLEEYLFDRPDLVEEFRWENLAVFGKQESVNSGQVNRTPITSPPIVKK